MNTNESPLAADDGKRAKGNNSQPKNSTPEAQAVEAFGPQLEMPQWMAHNKRKIPTNGQRQLPNNDPAFWTSFYDALDTAGQYGLPGVSLMFFGGIRLDGHRLIGIDVDKVSGPVELLEQLGTYTEVSISGNGRHAFVWVPEAWAEQYRDTASVKLPNCHHAEIYVGSAARHLCMTFDPLDGVVRPIRMLDEARLALLGKLLKPAEAEHDTSILNIEEGEPIDLSALKLSADEQHLLEVVGKDSLDRSPVVHGLLIKLFDKAQATPADALATMLKVPSLWAYCLFHRQDDPERALVFARAEVQRAWGNSLAGKRARLVSFNEGWKPKAPKPTVPFPAPFRGVMAEAVDAILAVAPRPQPELTTMAVLVGLATAVGGFFPLFNGGSGVNLYACGILSTAGGKDMPRRGACALASLAFANLHGKPASGEGLEDHVSPYRGTLVEIDELAHYFAAINGSRAPSYLITLNSMFLQFFSDSAHRHPIRARATKDGKRESEETQHFIERPALNLLGFSTPEKLGKTITVQNFEEGSIGRMLFVFGREDVDLRLLPENDNDIEDEIALTFPESVRKRIQHLHNCALQSRLVKPIRIHSKANRELNSLNREFEQGRKTSESPIAKMLFARGYEKALRVAGVLACCDNPADPVILPEHVEWAGQLVRASDAAVLRFTGEYMHGDKIQENAATLRKLLQRAHQGEFKCQRSNEVEARKEGWIGYSLLLRNADLNSTDCQKALDHLAALGEIEVNYARPAKVRLLAEGE